MYSMRAVCIRAHRSPDARRTGSRCPAGASWVWLQTPRRTAAGPRRTWRRRSAAAADLQRNDAPAAACLCPEALRYKTHWLTRCRNHCRSTPLSLSSVCYQLSVTLSSKPNTSEIKIPLRCFFLVNIFIFLSILKSAVYLFLFFIMHFYYLGLSVLFYYFFKIIYFNCKKCIIVVYFLSGLFILQVYGEVSSV